MSTVNASTPTYPQPTDEEIQKKAKEVLGKTPCLWQTRVCRELLRRKSVILVSPTGSGKSLTFWLPYLYEVEGVVILVSPLNALGAQLVSAPELATLGIRAIQLTRETTSTAIYKVNPILNRLVLVLGIYLLLF